MRVTEKQFRVLKVASLSTEIGLTIPAQYTTKETDQLRELLASMNESVKHLCNFLSEAYAEIDRLEAEKLGKDDG